MVRVERNGKLSDGFIPPEFLPAGKDQYYLRNLQQPRPSRSWRPLDTAERKLLEKNGNTAEEWDTVLVGDSFDPSRVRNTRFYGLVRIGRLEASVLEYDGLRLETGISDCTILDCDIGDDVVLRTVGFCARYIIGDACLLSSIDELQTGGSARFGCGILKEGEEEDERLGIDIMNEAGGRRILPFDGMIPADAYLWGKYRDDLPLMRRLQAITRNGGDSRRGFYGTIGDGTGIRSTGIIRDVRIGPNCSVTGAGRLENLTVNSSSEEPTRIGTGVELSGGIIGRGCRVLHGSRAERFVLGDNSSLSYGARLIDTVLGDNSTVSCCEMRNSLLFPAHEQHHNSSFLIASVIMGQSNLAAGATIGSNHNSRAADNELVAGRGFWPGLCVSLKYPSRFASYTLIAKGDYPAELDIRLPFSLVNNNQSAGRLEIMPAYWWNYNMYALMRNAGKFAARDRRVVKRQHIEFDFLAPDTTEEIQTGLELLEEWTRAALEERGEAVADVRSLLSGREPLPAGLQIHGAGIEGSRRPVIVLKAAAAWRAYTDMLWYYAAVNLIAWLRGRGSAGLDEMREALSGTAKRSWLNLGGQLLPEEEVDRLRGEIVSGTIADWNGVHERYDSLMRDYPQEKQRHAFGVYCVLTGNDSPGKEEWRTLMHEARRIQEYIRLQVRASRVKDFDGPFSAVSYRNPEEMQAVAGDIDDNQFIRRVETESLRFIAQTEEMEKRADFSFTRPSL